MQILSAIILSAVLASPAEDRFVIESEFGPEGEWTEEYLNDAWKALVRLMDNRKVTPPRGIQVTLKKDPNMRGIGGYATPTSIGFTSDAWPKERLRLWILAHELTNLFAVAYGGAGGYPSDWWANGRSPFPEYVSCLVMKELGYTEAADARRKDMSSKADHELYWKLHDRYGFALFSKFFKLVQADAIDMGLVGAPWPHPDEARSAYTMAYLSMAAGTNIADLCRAHGVGNEPDDWQRIHPEIHFRPYRVTAEEVDRVMAVREFLFTTRERGEGVEILRELYRNGKIYTALAAEKNDPIAAGPPVDGPMSFQVTSEFGDESAWTERFLTRAAAALVKVLGVEDVALPERVPIVLRKDASLGGISGGATETSIELTSDCWPEEIFRHWILTQELARLISVHLGGNLGDDWFGHGDKPFATYASSLALREMGFDGEADWVHEMHVAKPDHELYWRIDERGGDRWVARFFQLLREDGIDFAVLTSEDGVRNRYVMAYLSLACDTNLADLATGKLFEPHRITTEDVDRLLKRRGELFGDGKKESSRLRAQRERYRRGED